MIEHKLEPEKCPLCRGTGYYAFERKAANGQRVWTAVACTACTFHGASFRFPGQ
jgi:DnaJ-class molecular chaperone